MVSDVGIPAWVPLAQPPTCRRRSHEFRTAVAAGVGGAMKVLFWDLRVGVGVPFLSLHCVWTPHRLRGQRNTGEHAPWAPEIPSARWAGVH